MLAGKLPDGSAVTGGTHVGPDGQVMLFNLLYGNRGSPVGRFDIAKATPVANNTLTGTTSWFKPSPLTATSTDTVYKAGFGPLNVTAQGSVYVEPTVGTLVMGLPVVPTGQANAKISLSQGGIANLNSFGQSMRFSTKTPQDTVTLVGVVPFMRSSPPIRGIVRRSRDAQVSYGSMTGSRSSRRPDTCTITPECGSLVYGSLRSSCHGSLGPTLCTAISWMVTPPQIRCRGDGWVVSIHRVRSMWLGLRT